jgi:Zn finger protein HypA/HybF involved in hydrogenase expression
MRSSNYVQGNVIVHYSCGYVDFEEKFIESETSLKCPKCGKSLKQIGIDYGNPGFAFKCLDCEEFFNLPLELWVCKSCEHQFQLHQAIVENIYSYRLNETVREKVEKVVLYTSP